MSRAPLKAVLFDLDGTLLDSAPDLYEALTRLCADTGRETPSYSTAKQGVSRGVVGIFEESFGITPEFDEFEELRQRYLEHYVDCLGLSSALFEGLPALLKDLESRSIPWGVVTSKMFQYAEPLVSNNPDTQGCSVLIGGDCVQPGKPHPAPVEEACRRLGLAPNETVYIGDALKDIHSGKDAGCQTIAAGWGYLRDGDDITAWPADHHLDDSRALHKLLDSLL